jgi:hypothetical protein
MSLLWQPLKQILLHSRLISQAGMVHWYYNSIYIPNAVASYFAAQGNVGAHLSLGDQGSALLF